MIELRSISKTVREPDGSLRPLFDGLDLTVSDDARSVAVVGRSGSGKSTLLRVLAGLDLDHGGVYAHDGRRLPRTPAAMSRHRLERIGVVTQSYDLLPDRSVTANVRLGCVHRRRASADVAEALDLVGVGHLARKRPTQLSGGEAQRVAIARAIVKRPAIVLADEPTGALDQETEEDVLDLFERIQSRGTTFVIATHSDRVAMRCAHRVRIEGRRLVEVH